MQAEGFAGMMTAPPHTVSDESFRLLVESVEDYAIYMLDPRGHVTTWNAGAERNKGYTSAEILGKHFSRFFLPEDAAAGLPQDVLKRPRKRETEKAAVTSSAA